MAHIYRSDESARSLFPAEWLEGDVKLWRETPNGLLFVVTRPEGKRFVAKHATGAALGTEDDAQRYLVWRAGTGTPRLVARSGAATLLEFVDGPSLETVVAEEGDASQHEVMAALIASLRRTTVEKLPNLRRFEDQFQGLTTRATNPHADPADELYRDASSELARLLASIDRRAPIHGDLHPENAIRSERGWVAIDPKGFDADPDYECASFLCNPRGRVDIAADPERIVDLATTFSATLMGDPRRYIAWAFVHACLTAAWCDLGLVDDEHLPYRSGRLVMARAFQNVLGDL